MTIHKAIHKLRTDAKLSQEQFAALFSVSQQSVQKWENGDSVPDLSKIIKIAKHFGVSLDALILGNHNRIVEEMKGTAQIKPQYVNIHDWEFYSSNLLTEYEQSIEEGLDIEAYKDVFSSVSRLPKGETKKQLGDVLFQVVANAKQKEGYVFTEPSDWESIQELCIPHVYQKTNTVDIKNQIHGAWMGRVCGCMLGKTVEGIRTTELIPFLKETGNFPMHRYILKSDLTEEILQKYQYHFAAVPYADTIHSMPSDDDTNYTVLYQEIIEKYGKDFTPFDVSRAWLWYQPKDAYCTAERVAFCNFVKGYTPPHSAMYKNPYREWIGAQIRADYFGYINPGNPNLAAQMAWRDACISHTKNGIYGEMFVAAMLAVASQTQNTQEIIRGGLAQIPHTSRLYKEVTEDLEAYKKGTTQEEWFNTFYQQYDENNPHHWCHTISNARIVVASLLYGNGDFAKSVCMAVQAGFDTDCNGATVGSIIGMAKGIDAIPKVWQEPFHNKLQTAIFGIGTVEISKRAEKTLEHIYEK